MCTALSFIGMSYTEGRLQPTPQSVPSCLVYMKCRYFAMIYSGMMSEKERHFQRIQLPMNRVHRIEREKLVF